MPEGRLEKSSPPFFLAGDPARLPREVPMQHAMRVSRLCAALLVAFAASRITAASAAFDSWSPTGSMAVPRTQHSAARLSDGRVMAVGGITVGGTTATAEIYDPATGVWTLTNSMSTPRSRHTQTMLRDHTVLVTGGRFHGVS